MGPLLHDHVIMGPLLHDHVIMGPLLHDPINDCGQQCNTIDTQ